MESKKINTQEVEITPVDIMMSEIKKEGGELHFDVTFSQEGWTAVCREFPQIITWGDGAPSSETVAENTRDAVKSAFGIPNEMDAGFQLNKVSDPKNSYAPITVNINTTGNYSSYMSVY